tara:strand:+ start:499 stop:1143 length:645 start_codon:yes stop_codon:yes gene_type:complete
MKVYCDGCSWIKGAEIKDKTKKFSTLICNELGAEEVLAVGGETGTNCATTRRMVCDYNMSEFDMAIIQFATPSRTEYYDEYRKRFLSINSKLRYKGKFNHKNRVGYEHWDDSMVSFWRYYYTNVYHTEYGETQEQINHTTIRNLCQVNKVPLLFLTTRSDSTNMYQEGSPRMKYDFYLDDLKYPRVGRGAHPNEEGHRMIADDLLRMIDEKNLL